MDERHDSSRLPSTDEGSSPSVREPFELGLGSDPSVADCTTRMMAAATWAFVAIAILLRLIRFGLNFPLWGDEAFVAVNFTQRGYAELVGRLEYNQICPILFLWVELTCVKLFGFTETSLRLFPLACGLVSVFLFKHLAGRLLGGLPLLLAAAIFAVSFHPLRHATEAKPYACDLLASLLLLCAAIEWWRSPARNGWLWGLAALTPVALLVSHPAVFVAGGIGMVFAPAVLRTRSWRSIAPFVLFQIATVATFAAQYIVSTAAQSRPDALSGLQVYWAQSFPPLSNPLAFAGWFVTIHTGTMFAYPWGDRSGASALTTLAFAVGAVALWRSRRRVPVLLLLSPFLLTLIAAAARRYPYGGEARQMQFVAPSICLLAGLGLAVCIRAFPIRYRTRLVGSGLCLLALTAAVLARNDIVNPYRFRYDQQVRDFARRFWPTQTRDAEVVCLSWDARIREPGKLNLRTAIYLCNQAIYSPQRRAGGPRWQQISSAHPLRCVLYHDTRPDNPSVLAWLAEMRNRYELRGIERIEVDTSGAVAGSKSERLLVYEFAPADGESLAQPETRLRR